MGVENIKLLVNSLNSEKTESQSGKKTIFEI